MNREKRLTKREKKAAAPVRAMPQQRAQPQGDGSQHIHCVACGRHLDPSFFDAPATAEYVRCAHGSTFATCSNCVTKSKALLAEHDRTGQAVKAAAAWH